MNNCLLLKYNGKFFKKRQKIPIKSKQNKLIVLISTLEYVNKTHPKYKYNPNIILYYLNENLKRNGQNPIKLKTLQNYLYELEKKLKITTNYHKHMGVNCGTEIYYHLNYPKHEFYLKINQYYKEKKNFRFGSRVSDHYGFL